MSQCTALGSSRAGGNSPGQEVTFDPRSPGTVTRATIDSGGSLPGVVCPSTSQCTAVDEAGREVTFDPRSPGTPTPVVVYSGVGGLAAVACPSVSQCTAVALFGREVTFDPHSPGAPTPVVVDSAGNNSIGGLLNAVVCLSTSQCTTVDEAGREVTFDPRSPGTPTPVVVDINGNSSTVACPSAAQCTVVDDSGYEVTFDPTSPVTPIPNVVGSPIQGTYGAFGATQSPPTGVVCSSARECIAVGEDGLEVTFDPTSPGRPTETGIEACTQFVIHVGCVGPGLDAVACPSASQCTAVDDSGGEVTFDPRSPRTAIRRTIDSAGRLAAVACPSASQCTAVDAAGLAVTFDPSSPGVAAPTTIDGGHTLSGVVCPSTSQCTAIDDSGREMTFDPRSPRTAIRRTIDSAGRLAAVACPSARQCTAVDRAGREVTFDPRSPRISARTVVDRGQILSGVACGSASDCVAVDRAGRVVEGNPQRPGAWTFEPIAGAVPLSLVACSSVSQCVAVDQAGQGFVGTPSTDMTQIRSSASTSVAGQQVTLSATVSPTPESGSVSFLDDGRTIPGCGAVAIGASTRTADCRARFATPGSYGVQAAYTGDPGLTGSQSQSSTLKQTVRSSITLHGSSGNASRVSIRLGCAAQSQGCRITAALSAIETVRGGKPVAISARVHQHQRTVILAVKTVRIVAGRTVTVAIKLNAVGRTLVARFKRLPVRLMITLTVDGQHSIVAIRKLAVELS